MLITGASSGVGLEAARRFAAEGARLALIGCSEETLRQVISEHGLDAVAIAADVTDRKPVDAAIRSWHSALTSRTVRRSKRSWRIAQGRAARRRPSPRRGRLSPRGDSDPPAETLGPLGSAERLNWAKAK